MDYNQSKKLILIADQCAQRYKVYERILHAQGFDVHWVTALTDFFEAFIRLQPSLVIMDLNLCLSDTTDLIVKIKQASAGEVFVPILMASDQGENELLQYALAQKVDGFL
ncbi:MAG: response regulator, partial [Thiomicrospira sp.]